MEKKQVREKEWMAPCGFCAVGCCWYGSNCLRTLRSRFSETVFKKQGETTTNFDSESDYASADSGSDNCDDNADDADAAEPGCAAEAG